MKFIRKKFEAAQRDWALASPADPHSTVSPVRIFSSAASVRAIASHAIFKALELSGNVNGKPGQEHAKTIEACAKLTPRYSMKKGEFDENGVHLRPSCFIDSLSFGFSIL